MSRRWAIFVFERSSHMTKFSFPLSSQMRTGHESDSGIMLVTLTRSWRTNNEALYLFRGSKCILKKTSNLKRYCKKWDSQLDAVHMSSPAMRLLEHENLRARPLRVPNFPENFWIWSGVGYGIQLPSWYSSISKVGMAGSIMFQPRI